MKFRLVNLPLRIPLTYQTITQVFFCFFVFVFVFFPWLFPEDTSRQWVISAQWSMGHQETLRSNTRAFKPALGCILSHGQKKQLDIFIWQRCILCITSISAHVQRWWSPSLLRKLLDSAELASFVTNFTGYSSEAALSRRWWKCSNLRRPIWQPLSHMRNWTSATEELNVWFYLIFIHWSSPMWLAVTILGRRVNLKQRSHKWLLPPVGCGDAHITEPQLQAW